MRSAPITAINMRNVALKIHNTFHLRNRNLGVVMLEAVAAYQSYKMYWSCFIKLLEQYFS